MIINVYKNMQAMTWLKNAQTADVASFKCYVCITSAQQQTHPHTLVLSHFAYQTNTDMTVDRLCIHSLHH